jgi:hypothetical protein
VTGLIRPVDVTLDPEGALVVADFIYGHIWRVRYTGNVEAVERVASATPVSRAADAGASMQFATATPEQ